MSRFTGTPTWSACRLALLTRQVKNSFRVLARTSFLENIVEGPAVWDDPDAPIVSAYLHLPFCKRRCYYCDFPVVTTGDPERDVVQDRFEAYIDQLCSEIRKQPRWNAEPLHTIFFGGGTPSLIAPVHLQKVLDTLDSTLGISAGAEITMEADPGTFDSQKLHDYMHAGVNRFSIGVQAFSQETLELCGRSHNFADVKDAIRAVHDSKPPSWSLDLISGLPGVSLKEWEGTMQQAIQAQPSHISIYDLQVEPGTAFERWQETGGISLPEESTAVRSWRRSRELLCSGGFDHYELSNFAQPGHKCAHNMVYWKGYSYYAFGMGAASYLHGVRTSRPRTLKAWHHYVDQLSEAKFAVASPPEMVHERMLEAIMLQLRLVRGIDCTWFAAGFGRDNLQQLLHGLNKHEPYGRVIFAVGQVPATANEVVKAADMGITSFARLSDPDGLLLSNDIISDVFLALEV